MINLFNKGAFLVDNKELISEENIAELENYSKEPIDKEQAKKGTITYDILKKHNQSDSMKSLRLKFDSMTSHDLTYVGIIQTAKASGMTEFPIPYVLTNCHNSLCAVGGTINGDDHTFGMSAAKRYGGIFVPPHVAVIHQFMRETMAGCEKMIIGSDSHTRYGALGTMAVGEGGGELVKQILGDTYDIEYPDVVAIYLDGKPQPGIGPQDIALAIIGQVFKNGYVKNKVMEFVGPGIANLSTDFRNGIDVMTTETACLTSIWQTDEDTKQYLTIHGRADDYKELQPKSVAYYDGAVYVDLSKVESMIALPFHPSNVFSIKALNENLSDILHGVEVEAKKLINNPKIDFKLTDKIQNNQLKVQQGIIAGCAGGNYNNIIEAAEILSSAGSIDKDYSLSIYPSSIPVYMELAQKGIVSELMATGAIVKTAFCGPCFGAGDTPSNNGLSIRHTTRNFINRDGSKPGNGQMTSVALMDARSIAATTINNGILTPATEVVKDYPVYDYTFDGSAYEKRVYQGFLEPHEEDELVYGPNIKDWPNMSSLGDHVLLRVCSKILDDVTTTDELIPSGETSSYRSNPLGLAEYTLSRRDPEYVERAKAVAALEIDRAENNVVPSELSAVYNQIKSIYPNVEHELQSIEIGGVIYCTKPGDGSAREQAASCQRVLGGLANICKEYATKRYRSNVINWGMLPFQMVESPEFEVDDYIFIPDIKKAIATGEKKITGYIIGDTIKEIHLYWEALTDNEKAIVLSGSLINYNRDKISLENQ
ncbi:hydratase [Lacrimispora algidixylanolytica]|uniref:Hydratase n=1 Tax=Lacrimispora algidixylanolytica TaxID=94868 RepID=A0A419TCK8_9FIRM|nr:hydratase [Lacrimispora algidixylanolytica]RKD35213.1 hydratase [Lacrimispora algidixylanolytica]